MLRPLHHAQILGVAALIAVVAPSLGCGQTACFQWLESEGACPDRTQARTFFGNCNDIDSINDNGKFGNGLCCYSVTKVAGRADGIDCTGPVGVGVGPGPGTGVVTAVSVGPSGPSTVSSTSSGGGKCDFMGFCGDTVSGCMGCALSGPCAGALDACATSAECTLYQDCAAKCAPQMPNCLTQCANKHPMGATLYDALVNCTICQNCPNSCPSMAQNCSSGSTSSSGMGGAGGAGMGGAGGK